MAADDDLMDYSDVGRDVIINSISFSEGVVEIQYLEKREQADDCGMMRVILARSASFASKVDAILDEAEEIIDETLLRIRNPESSFDPRKRLSRHEEEG